MALMNFRQRDGNRKRLTILKHLKTQVLQSLRPVVIVVGQEHCSLTRTLILPFVNKHFWAKKCPTDLSQYSAVCLRNWNASFNSSLYLIHSSSRLTLLFCWCCHGNWAAGSRLIPNLSMTISQCAMEWRYLLQIIINNRFVLMKFRPHIVRSAF